MVFLQGATLDHQAWQPQIDALRARSRIVAPDLRGHGASTGTFCFDAAVETSSPAWRGPATAPAVLVGLSLG